MFGTLRTHSCSLGSGARREHERFYCGLCKTLGAEFGQALRITLSYDAVFMAILADALQDAGAVEASYRCPLVPVHHRPAVAHDSPAMRYAAAVQVLLGDQWLADRGADGRRLARLTRPLLRAPVARAQGLLRDFGVDVGTLDGMERRQQEIEAGRPTPGEAAKPTSSALGLVFAAVADLPGTITAVRSDTGRRRLGALGSTIGSVIYLTDALEDIHEDRRRGNFNPCLEGDVVAPERLRDARQDLSRALERMSALVDRVPWQRHREVIANILCDRLAGQSRRAMEITRLDVDGREGSQHGENGGRRGGEARDNCARSVSQRRSGSATAYLRPAGSTMSNVMSGTTGGGPEGAPARAGAGSGRQEQGAGPSCGDRCWDYCWDVCWGINCSDDLVRGRRVRAKMVDF